MSLSEIAGFGFTPDGRWLATVEETAGVLRLWDVDAQHTLAIESSKAVRALSDVTFFDWQLVLSGRKAWSTRSVRDARGEPSLTAEKAKYALPKGRTGRPVLSRDGRWMATVLHDRDALVWPVDDYPAARRFKHQSLNSVTLSTGGKYLATSFWREKWVRIWDVETGKLLQTVEGQKWPSAVFDHGTRHVVISDSVGLTTYQLEPWKQVAHRSTQRGPAGLTLHPTEDLLAYTDAGGQVTLLRPATLEVVVRLTPPYSVVGRDLRFSPDGQRLAVSRPSEHGIEIWDLGVVREHLRSMGLDWTPSQR